MIQLSEWYYYRGSYCTKGLVINTTEISEVIEIDDPYRNISGSIICMKNGNNYRVKEPLSFILSMIEERRADG